MATIKNLFATASFEEKSAWVQLAGMALLLGGYFTAAGMLLADGVTGIAPFIPLFIVTMILLVAFQAAGHAVATLTSPSEDADERDHLIAWRAEARSSYVLGAGLIGAVACLVLAVDTAWVANVLLLSMALAQMLCCLLQIVSYRRGI